MVSTALRERSSAGASESDEPAPQPATEQATTEAFERPPAPLAMRRLTPRRLADFHRNPPSLVDKSFLCSLPDTADNAADNSSGPTEPHHDDLFFQVVGYMKRPKYVMCVLFEGRIKPNQQKVNETME